MIGGIVANTLPECVAASSTTRTGPSSRWRFVLPSGTEIDTGGRRRGSRVRRAGTGVAAGLMALRARIQGDPRTVERIRTKYR